LATNNRRKSVIELYPTRRVADFVTANFNMPTEYLHALTDEVAAAAQNLTDEQADQALTLVDGLRGRFQLLFQEFHKENAQAMTLLQLLPQELMVPILSQLYLPDLACLAATCCLLWCDAPAAPERHIGIVEAELRCRVKARGLDVGSSLPEGAASWVPYLLKLLLKPDLRDAQKCQASLAAGSSHSVFMDREAACPPAIRSLLGHVTGHDWGENDIQTIGSVLMPSMRDRRVVSVASGDSRVATIIASLSLDERT